nr:response regulator [Paenibacillus lignilyticus]
MALFGGDGVYSVLVVDDETMDLIGLQQHIDWDKLGMNVVAAINNSFSALEYMKNNKVDILVTDINMPIMSGLEMVRQILEQRPQLRVVFVSGYSEFHYAKQAISLSAAGYVLKPVNDDELFEVLEGVKAELDSETTRSEWHKSEAVSQLLSGNYARTELTPSAGLSIGIIEMDDMHWKLRAAGVEKQTTAFDKQLQQIAELLMEMNLPYFCKTDEKRMVVILEGAQPQEQLKLVMHAVSSKLTWSVTAGVGTLVYELHQIPESYQCAREAIANKMFYGKGKVIPFSDIKPQTGLKAKQLSEVLDSLFTALVQYQLVRVDECVEDLSALIKTFDDKHAVYVYLLHVISQLDFRLRTVNEDLYQILGLSFDKLDIVFQFETVEDIQWWLRSRLFQLSETLYQRKQKKNRKLIEEVEKYIMDHVEEELTLKDVANYFSFSPNYLGYMFKEEAGLNFSDYVIAKRMERASVLLQVPSTKVYEVANRLGYKKLSSFNRQFKDQFGLTPSDYRKQG